MLLLLPILVALFGVDPEPTATIANSQWLSDIRAENRETRHEALLELGRRLERGDAEAETIRGFVLTGLETDHSLSMVGSLLVDLIPVEALPHLTDALSDPIPEIRSRAVAGLGAIGPEAAVTLDRLLFILRNDSDDVARVAGAAISRIDVAGSTFPELLKMMMELNIKIKHRAAQALDRFGDRVYPIVPEVIPLLRDNDEQQRYWLVNVIANSKANNPAVVEILVKLLREDPSPYVRRRVAREFWEMGHNRNPIPASANEALIQTLKQDSDNGVREQVAKALASNQRLLTQNGKALKECINDQTGQLREVCKDAIRGKYR